MHSFRPKLVASGRIRRLISGKDDACVIVESVKKKKREPLKSRNSDKTGSRQLLFFYSDGDDSCLILFSS